MTAACATCAGRRSVLAMAAMAGAAGATAAMSGCQAYGAAAPAGAAATAAPAGPRPDKQAGPAPGDQAKATGSALAQVADIPVGGGKVFADQNVVVTQPSAGSVMAFSAVCTHAGCTVGEVSDGTINCPCHRSRFRVADGSVAAGPAGKPLPPVAIAVEGATIRLA